MPLFAMPLAFAALASLPALAAIYWMRNRHRHHTVSTLALWVDPRTPREGGQRLQRLQLPLLFFIELLALLFLSLAAARPQIHSTAVQRRVIVILDDSYSMQAGQAKHTVKDRAMASLMKLLDEQRPFRARFILAGTQAQILGPAVTRLDDVRKQMKQWACQSPSADLGRALGMAHQLSGRSTDLLVLTDHKPDDPPHSHRFRWWAFGKSHPNVAFINAVRATLDDQDRVMIEVQNFSKAAADTSLTVAGKKRAVHFDAGEARQFWFKPAESGKPFRASLGHDALDCDNHVLLLPVRAERLPVELAMADKPLREALDRALHATGETTRVTREARLLITDGALPAKAPPGTWFLRVFIAKDGPAYVGPYLIDRTTTLTEGLSLPGVVWAAAAKPRISGVAVIKAADVPLLTRSEAPDGRRTLQMRLVPQLSTLLENAAFPILVRNIVDWRLTHLPGLSRVNLPLGAQTVLAVRRGVTSVTVTPPRGEDRHLSVAGGRVQLQGDEAGIYTLKTPAPKGAKKGTRAAWPKTYRVAVNAMNSDESDLTTAATGQWGEWKDAPGEQPHVISLAWLCLVAVIALLALHGYLLATRGGQNP